MDMAAAPGMGPLGRLRSAGCTCLVREHCQLRHQAHDPRLRLCSCQYRCACDLTPLGGAGGKGPLPCIPFFPHVGASEDMCPCSRSGARQQPDAGPADCRNTGSTGFWTRNTLHELFVGVCFTNEDGAGECTPARRGVRSRVVLLRPHPLPLGLPVQARSGPQCFDGDSWNVGMEIHVDCMVCAPRAGRP